MAPMRGSRIFRPDDGVVILSVFEDTDTAVVFGVTGLVAVGFSFLGGSIRVGVGVGMRLL